MQARIHEVLSSLSTGRVIRASELAARLETTERTIRRDIAALRAQGYRVDSAPGIGGGYVAPSGVVLPPLQFTSREVFTLAVALRALSGQGLRASRSDVEVQQTQHVESAMRKLRSVLPPGIDAELKQASNAITAAQGNEPEVPLDVMVALAAAIAQHRLVDLVYRGGKQDGERRIEPYRIVVFGAHWYLFAWDLTRADWRTFRLDRISSVHNTTFEFRRRAIPDPIEYVRHQVSQSVYQTMVTVRMYASAAEISQLVPARAATVTAVTADECELQIGANTAEWLVAFLLSLGHPFTIVEPTSFRREIRRIRDRLNDVLA